MFLVKVKEKTDAENKTKTLEKKIDKATNISSNTGSSLNKILEEIYLEPPAIEPKMISAESKRRLKNNNTNIDENKNNEPQENAFDKSKDEVKQLISEIMSLYNDRL